MTLVDRVDDLGAVERVRQADAEILVVVDFLLDLVVMGEVQSDHAFVHRRGLEYSISE